MLTSIDFLCFAAACPYNNQHNRGDRCGVSGKKDVGCDAIVVSRQETQYREKDNLSWLLYSATTRSKAGAMHHSWQRDRLIRVFRSSKLTNKFAPPKLCKQNETYRYDGVCMVKKVWAEDGKEMDKSNSSTETHKLHTFALERDESETTTQALLNSCKRKPSMPHIQKHDPVLELQEQIPDTMPPFKVDN